MLEVKVRDCGQVRRRLFIGIRKVRSAEISFTVLRGNPDTDFETRLNDSERGFSLKPRESSRDGNAGELCLNIEFLVGIIPPMMQTNADAPDGVSAARLQGLPHRRASTTFRQTDRHFGQQSFSTMNGGTMNSVHELVQLEIPHAAVGKRSTVNSGSGSGGTERSARMCLMSRTARGARPVACRAGPCGG